MVDSNSSRVRGLGISAPAPSTCPPTSFPVITTMFSPPEGPLTRSVCPNALVRLSVAPDIPLAAPLVPELSDNVSIWLAARTLEPALPPVGAPTVLPLELTIREPDMPPGAPAPAIAPVEFVIRPFELIGRRLGLRAFSSTPSVAAPEIDPLPPEVAAPDWPPRVRAATILDDWDEDADEDDDDDDERVSVIDAIGALPVSSCGGRRIVELNCLITSGVNNEAAGTQKAIKH